MSICLLSLGKSVVLAGILCAVCGANIPVVVDEVKQHGLSKTLSSHPGNFAGKNVFIPAPTPHTSAVENELSNAIVKIASDFSSTQKPVLSLRFDRNNFETLLISKRLLSTQ